MQQIRGIRFVVKSIKADAPKETSAQLKQLNRGHCKRNTKKLNALKYKEAHITYQKI